MKEMATEGRSFEERSRDIRSITIEIHGRANASKSKTYFKHTSSQTNNKTKRIVVFSAFGVFVVGFFVFFNLMAWPANFDPETGAPVWGQIWGWWVLNWCFLGFAYWFCEPLKEMFDL